MKDQVRRMAENDEPKCGNCKNWKTWDLVPEAQADVYKECLHQRLPTGMKPFLTLDLSLCSAWEPKE